MFWAEPAWPAKAQNGRQDGLNEHVQHRDEEWEWEAEMFGREHPFVIQGQHERENEPNGKKL